MAEEDRRLVIGYALKEKKRQSFLVPSLEDCCRARGIDLVPVDSAIPLVEQGPFNALVHKLSGEEWERQIQEFCSKYPDVPVIDPPEAIAKLHSRISMLEGVCELEIWDDSLTVEVPWQAVVYRSEQLCSSEDLGPLKYPLIAKPLVADGTAVSHSMSLVLNESGLCALKPPLVLQEFVNHGGVIFKVYVVGEFVKCVTRNSLPDISKEHMRDSADGILSFSQISNTPSLCTDTKTHVEPPPEGFVQNLAYGLRKRLGLQLFNFDVIRDAKTPTRCLVIDINYFPGYAKMPGFESALTDFFLNIVNKSNSATA